MDNTIIIIQDRYSKSKKETLKRIVLRKKKILLLVTSRYELLKMELDLIKREYYFRVGSVLEKDNQLDMDIIAHKNILSLMKMGLSYKNALEKIHEANHPVTDFEQEQDKEEFIAEQDNNMKQDGLDINKLKQLWKKAVIKFHPDLTPDPEEKKKREDIMKKINKAYTERDINTLQDLYKNTFISNPKEISIEQLEQMIVNVENRIIMTKKDFSALKQTEWYRWKAKMRIAKKSGIDIFKEMEDALLDDVVKKMQILSELKREIRNVR